MKKRLAVLIAGPMFAFAAMANDDCKFNQDALAEYKANCRQTDGCAYEAQMRQIVAASCGTSAAKPPRQPAATQAQDPGSADAGDTSSDSGGVPKISVKPTPTTGTPLPKDVNHEGKPCTYFNGRPSVESGDGTTRMNWYGKGAKVCHGKWLYVCGDDMRWKVYSWCPANGKQSEEFETGL
jgi:hypothetical protein